MGSIPGSEDPLKEALQSTSVFLPGKSHGQRSWWATVHRVAKSQTRWKQLSMRTLLNEIMQVQQSAPKPSENGGIISTYSLETLTSVDSEI